MGRLGSRVLAAVGAVSVALALTVGSAGSVGAAPSSGPITQARNMLGVWLGEMTGYQEGQEVVWQYRLTVRKVKGQAGVAWAQWRDCKTHKLACEATRSHLRTDGVGWGEPSRLQFVIDKAGTIRGVTEFGGFTATSDATGTTIMAVMLCANNPMTMVPYVGMFAVGGALVRSSG